MAKPTKEDAIRRLQKQLDEIPGLKELRHGSTQFSEWRRNTRVSITYTFEEESSQVKDFQRIKYSDPMFVGGIDNEIYFQRAYVSGLESATAVLRSMIHEIQEFWPDNSQESSSSQSKDESQPVNASQVFVIHGRDHGTRDTVASFLRKLELEPVILEEQPNRGRTIIEKFEEYVQGDFAVALLTPDDMGGLSNDELQPRARQNVIFEFGYCIGKFGRDRVLALVKGDPEIPSDYSGVLYIPMDESGGWQMRLIREMNSVGFNIDANLAL